MGGTMQAKAMGRSPPCAVCGRICHFGFVTLDLAEGIAATSPCNGSGGGGDVATGARAIEGDGWGKLRVTCTAHADDLCVLAEAGTTASRTRLVHYMRYDDDELSALCQDAAARARRQSLAHCAIASQHHGGANWSASAMLEPPVDGPVLPEAVARAVAEGCKAYGSKRARRK